MGVFRKLGRRVEEFKNTAEEAAEESKEFRCGECGTRFATQQRPCPECGAEAVEPVEEPD